MKKKKYFYEERFLTDEEIIERLKELGLDNTDKPRLLGRMWLIVPNLEYDPGNFSQEIEDSEEMINWVEEMHKKTHEPGFDWVWNNTLSEIKSNSDEWLKNHSKRCKFQLTHFLYQTPQNDPKVLEKFLGRIKYECEGKDYEGIYHIC